MDGVAVLDEWQREQGLQGTPVVFLAAGSDASHADHLRAPGASAILFKPFGPMTLAMESRKIRTQSCAIADRICHADGWGALPWHFAMGLAVQPFDRASPDNPRQSLTGRGARRDAWERSRDAEECRLRVRKNRPKPRKQAAIP